MIIKVLGLSPTLDATPNGPKHDTRSNGPKDGVAAPWQIQDADLFRRFPLILNVFWCETTWIGFLIKLSFQPYVDHQKRSSYACWVTSLRQTGPVGRGRLELELLWASTSWTRTELASGLLLDLDTLAGLLPLHTMRQTWSYAWVLCPHHPPLIDEKSSSTSIVLETDPAQHKGEWGCKDKGNWNNCEKEHDHVSKFLACHLA